MIKKATLADAQAIVNIYNHYVENSTATFETSCVSKEQMIQRICSIQQGNLPWLVAVSPDNSILGYAYASQWKARDAYKHCVEITVYLLPSSEKKGIASALYSALFAALKATKIHTAIACVALPNDASVALHERFNMRKVAHFSQVGKKFDKWIDVGYWQGLLDD